MQKWSLYKENANWVIRRWENGKNVRLPLAQYRHFREDEKTLRDFVTRINAPITTARKVEIKHAFIDPAMLEEYLDFLIAQIPTERNARCEFSYLTTYFLHYFIGQLDLVNPLDWYRVHKTKWATFLLSDQVPASSKTKRGIIIAANRFMKWLHERRPNEVPLLTFQPISKAKYKEVEASREASGLVVESKMISVKDWKKIEKKLPVEIRACVMLAYSYGLRRSETLGLEAHDVRKAFLSAERQMVCIGKTGPLKGREQRKIPHWFVKPGLAYKWIEERKLVHPDTLTELWRDLMDSLGMAYRFHDIRHTFITRALRKQAPRDVQLAAGHKDITTTMRYAHDDRDLGAEEFRPTG